MTVERLIIRRTAAELIVRYEAARLLSRRVPAEIFTAVMLRDNGCCRYCQSTELVHLDHIHPYSKGGPTSVENLQVLCARCNLGKGTLSDAEARMKLGFTAAS